MVEIGRVWYFDSGVVILWLWLWEVGDAVLGGAEFGKGCEERISKYQIHSIGTI